MWVPTPPSFSPPLEPDWGRVTPYLLVTPLITAVIGVTWFGDELNARIVTGALASMAGVVIVALSEVRRARLAAAAASSPPV